MNNWSELKLMISACYSSASPRLASSLGRLTQAGPEMRSPTLRRRARARRRSLSTSWGSTRSRCFERRGSIMMICPDLGWTWFTGGWVWWSKRCLQGFYDTDRLNQVVTFDIEMFDVDEDGILNLMEVQHVLRCLGFKGFDANSVCSCKIS